MSYSDYVKMPSTDYTAFCDAIREWSKTDTVIKSGELVERVNQIICCKVNQYGQLYVENVVVPDAVTTLAAGIYDVPGIKSIYAPEVNTLSGHYTCGGSKSTAEQLIFPKMTNPGGAYICLSNTLNEVQFGSIGYAVTILGSICFKNSVCTPTITLYVDATTLSEIPTDITNNAPFGAANATIVYRNSTTGEVITA